MKPVDAQALLELARELADALEKAASHIPDLSKSKNVATTAQLYRDLISKAAPEAP